MMIYWYIQYIQYDKYETYLQLEFDVQYGVTLSLLSALIVQIKVIIFNINQIQQLKTGSTDKFSGIFRICNLWNVPKEKERNSLESLFPLHFMQRRFEVQFAAITTEV